MVASGAGGRGHDQARPWLNRFSSEHTPVLLRGHSASISACHRLAGGMRVSPPGLWGLRPAFERHLGYTGPGVYQALRPGAIARISWA